MNVHNWIYVYRQMSFSVRKKMNQNHQQNHVLKAISKFMKTAHKVISNNTFYNFSEEWHCSIISWIQIIIQETTESKIVRSLINFAFARNNLVQKQRNWKKVHGVTEDWKPTQKSNWFYWLESLSTSLKIVSLTSPLPLNFKPVSNSCKD